MTPRLKDCEILVHVDAPALTAHDVAYRQLAQAYLGFQPSEPTHLPHPDFRREGLGSEVASETSDHSPHSLVGLRGKPKVTARPEENRGPSREENPDKHFVGERNDSPVEFIGRSFDGRLDEQAAEFDSQDLSFEGVLDNRDSPRLRVEHDGGQIDDLIIPSSLPENSSSQQSWSQPPSEVADSYPMPPKMSYSSPSRILRQWTTPQSAIPATPAVTMDVLPSQLVAQTLGRRERNQKESFPLSGPSKHTINAQNIVLATPPLPTSATKRNMAEGFSDYEYAEITHITTSDLDQSPRPSHDLRAESAPVETKRRKTALGSASPPQGWTLLNRSASETLGTPRRELYLNVKELWAGLPPIGVDDIEPSSFVSEKLDKLASQLSSRYRPQAARDVEPFERGYWLVDSTSWDIETHIAFWEFLTPYLKNGLAGWGVWCKRDDTRRWIRLYCWGHIVKHTYLLLYLASGRQMKVTGAEWMDGAGDMVIRVPPLAKAV